MVSIEPIFKIYGYGNVICKSHSNYESLMSPRKSFIRKFKLNRALTCKTCDHYKIDDCFFSKYEIDNILSDMGIIKSFFKTKYKCESCGARIEKKFSVMYKLYLEQVQDIEIPLLCCYCHTALAADWITGSFKLRVLGYVILLICCVLALVPIVQTLFTLERHNVFVYLMAFGFLLFFGIIIVKLFSALSKLKNGKNYLSKFR